MSAHRHSAAQATQSGAPLRVARVVGVNLVQRARFGMIHFEPEASPSHKICNPKVFGNASRMVEGKSGEVRFRNLRNALPRVPGPDGARTV